MSRQAEIRCQYCGAVETIEVVGDVTVVLHACPDCIVKMTPTADQAAEVDAYLDGRYRNLPQDQPAAHFFVKGSKCTKAEIARINEAMTEAVRRQQAGEPVAPIVVAGFD